MVCSLNEKLGKALSGDLNDFTETGMYWVVQSGSTNLPESNPGALMVVSTFDYSFSVQFFSGTLDRYFIRCKVNNSWNAWNEYATKSYIKPWAYIGSYDLVVDATQTEVPYGDKNALEFLFSYGRKNQDQSYGGGTLIIRAEEGKPSCLPVYVPPVESASLSAKLVGYVYIYNDVASKKIILRNYGGTDTLRVIIRYR